LKRKEDLHAEAEQETQLVRMKNSETLEGKVDLAKVKDIRRALRRRYATRTNFQKIFSQWDNESKGHIEVKDIHRMMNNMGLKVNLDEA
jgi:Ca2+-binding EF-hand superfamily protein